MTAAHWASSARGGAPADRVHILRYANLPIEPLGTSPKTETKGRPAMSQRVAVRSATDLATMSPKEFFSHMAEVNTAARTAAAAHAQASTQLVLMLTEQLARHIQTKYPTAALVFFRTGADFHQTASGHQDPHCEGHNHRFIPFEVVDHEGTTISGFDTLDAAHYIAERLTPHLGVHDYVFDLEARDWTIDD